ncbi:hypothetical protein QVG61_03480 [Thiohalobacter sp. IOR34]|uniref:PEP-CTERM sorting domain-containing protein n=1 Tax=Thiohalobacter sp. IOR34 TaxID=3057176 RepID=UPI0025B11243|nr:PEP-CTERM sorting domain-containing protein [Thiohalobacter sp. IOR34]WJW76166.1 hypothetical protein QVG61_03480 [Thiohalobacter sp. IOR34]
MCKILSKFWLLAALCLGMATAQAVVTTGNQVWLQATTPTVAVGDTLSIDLVFDFSSDPTLGGVVDISYDSTLLSFSGYGAPATGWILTAPTTTAGSLTGLGLDALTASTGGSVLTLDFLAIGAGTASIGVANSGAWNTFYDANNSPQSVTFTGTSVTVSAVPLPAALWLMLGGLGLLGWQGRRLGS